MYTDDWTLYLAKDDSVMHLSGLHRAQCSVNYRYWSLLSSSEKGKESRIEQSS